MEDKKALEELHVFIHDLFIYKKYIAWVDKITRLDYDKWYSLVAELDKEDCPYEELVNFGKDIYMNLVFRCMKAPNYKKTGNFVILFCLVDTAWSSFVLHRPKSTDSVLK